MRVLKMTNAALRDALSSTCSSIGIFTALGVTYFKYLAYLYLRYPCDMLHRGTRVLVVKGMTAYSNLPSTSSASFYSCAWQSGRMYKGACSLVLPRACSTSSIDSKLVYVCSLSAPRIDSKISVSALKKCSKHSDYSLCLHASAILTIDVRAPALAT